jgi:hypothetical protein
MIDLSSTSNAFYVKILAVVVGGVLLLLVGTVLRWLGIPFKLAWQNRRLRKLVERRREFILVYNPQTGACKPMRLEDEGRITQGKNQNEDTWRIRRGCLEFVTDDGKLYNRFKLDHAHGRLYGMADEDVLAVFGQYLLPQY